MPNRFLSDLLALEGKTVTPSQYRALALEAARDLRTTEKKPLNQSRWKKTRVFIDKERLTEAFFDDTTRLHTIAAEATEEANALKLKLAGSIILAGLTTFATGGNPSALVGQAIQLVRLVSTKGS
jgi:hypothetical protein